MRYPDCFELSGYRKGASSNIDGDRGEMEVMQEVSTYKINVCSLGELLLGALPCRGIYSSHVSEGLYTNSSYQEPRPGAYLVKAYSPRPDSHPS